MGGLDYAALLIDLDGTLIGRDERISPRVSEAVREVAGRVHVSIASGREPSDVLRYAGELGLTAPQVSDNGAVVLDPASGAALWSSPLDAAHARRVVTTLHDLGIAFIATHPGRTITDPSAITDWDLARVSGLDMEERSADELVAHFAPDPGLHVVKVSLPYNGLWAVDFTRAGVDKGEAARQLGRVLGTDTCAMIGVGDSYNDVPLLRACRLRIAMGGAPDELTALADYVAPAVDDDGLAVAIEQFIAPRL